MHYELIPTFPHLTRLNQAQKDCGYRNHRLPIIGQYNLLLVSLFEIGLAKFPQHPNKFRILLFDYCLLFGC